MSTQTENTYVARQDDLQTLQAHWDAACSNGFQSVLLTAPIGGGKRALVGQLCQSAKAQNEDVILLRPNFSDEEDGQGAMIKLYSTLFGYLHSNPGLRGKIEMALNSQIPNQPARVQNWYLKFIEGLKKSIPKPGQKEFQIQLPRDNPLLAYVEIVQGIARKFPTIIDLQNLHNVQSLPLMAMLEALLDEGKKSQASLKLLLILHMRPVEGNENWLSLPLQDILKRRADSLEHLAMQPWGEAEVGNFLTSKSLDTSHAAKIAEITTGRPGFVAELADWLASDEDLASKINDLTLDNIADFSPDADELEEPENTEQEEGKRKFATADDADDVAYLSALLGLSFPSGLIADMGGYDRNSIDDLYDATEDMYRELQRSEPLNTWVYQFKKAIFRESILNRRQEDKDKQVAQRVGVFLERNFVPRAYGYLTKTLHIYARSGADARANLLRNAAMSADQPQFWNLARDIFAYFDECEWPEAMIRTTLLHLSDRLVKMGDVKAAEEIIAQGMAFADKHEDKFMRALLLMNGSKLDRRRQDLYRARERAQQALDIYNELEDVNQQGEAMAQLAIIELADGNPNAALDKARTAEETADIPPVKALCTFIKACIAQQEKNIEKAIPLFQEANQLAGQAGRPLLALESGMKMGESLLVSRQLPQAADVLGQVVNMARGLRAFPQERAISAMLAQAHAGQQNFESALKAASRTLKLTQDLGFKQFESVDCYNVGLFTLMMKKPSEAVSLFKKAQQSLPGNAAASFTKELLFNMGMAQLQIGETNAGEKNLRAAIQPATQSKDWTKVLVGHQQLAELANSRGDKQEAQLQLNQALRVADNTKDKEARKRIKDRLRALR